MASTVRRSITPCLVALVTLVLVSSAFTPLAAQSAGASLSGRVAAEGGSAVPGAIVRVKNPATGQERRTTTNDEGLYSFSYLPAATYAVSAVAEGFASAEIPNVVLNVGDQRSLLIGLKVAGVSETMTVTARAALVNQSPAVATVVDRQLVENLPLNGRSFQSLITLTPGANLGMAGGGVANSLAFSVNGQRTSSNYFTVDGVSANASAPSTITMYEAAGGGAPTVSVTGGTQAIVPIDAMQEFTIQTSTYGAKYGRQPGGQVQIVTRSGTNQFLGSVFEYFRNEKLDAIDWFTNRSGLPKPPLRQNDFGFVAGGPVVQDRTFFFGAYEGVRLRIPRSGVGNTASQAFRDAAAPEVRKLLAMSPLPNGPVSGNTGQFSASFSDPQTLDSYSLRLDQIVGNRLTAFGRFSNAPSEGKTRSSSLPYQLGASSQSSSALTLGTTWLVTDRLSNDLRLNYTRSRGAITTIMDSFAGAKPPDARDYLPSFADPATSGVLISIAGIDDYYDARRFGNNLQRQFNVVDDVSYYRGNHHWEAGVDYRQLNPHSAPLPYQLSITVLDPVAGRARYSVMGRDPATFMFKNLSVYGQDSWTVNPRLTLTYGLRWEYVPPPYSSEGAKPLSLNGLDGDLSQVTLDQPGAKLWKTTTNNFAPRLGAAYILRSDPGRETVLRGGAGVYYDLGYATFGNFLSSAPYSRTVIIDTVTMPIDSNRLQKPPLNYSTPVSTLNVFARDMKLPYTVQWNLSVQQSLGTEQSITASLVGAAGRRLISTHQFVTRSIYPGRSTQVSVLENGGSSDYHALQLQYQRRLSHGLSALTSYSLAKAVDDGSYNSILTAGEPGGLSPHYYRGPADFDVRHIVTGALTYDIPAPSRNGFLRASLGNWSVDTVFRYQSASPVNVITQQDAGFGYYIKTVDRVADQPLFIYDRSLPGGKRLNPAAFAPVVDNRPGNMSRNSVRGFGSQQVDLGLKRIFHLAPAVSAQLRVDVFNVFNHPNFSRPSGYLGAYIGQKFYPDAGFGVSKSMLNQGLYGLDSLHQMGGPRSTQIGLKVSF